MLLAEHSTLMTGYREWMRNADPGELEQVRSAYREASWLGWGTRGREAPLNSASAIAAWKAAWMAGGSEADVNRRMLQQQGIALNAPVNFQLRPEQYNPATY